MCCRRIQSLQKKTKKQKKVVEAREKKASRRTKKATGVEEGEEDEEEKGRRPIRGDKTGVGETNGETVRRESSSSRRRHFEALIQLASRR